MQNLGNTLITGGEHADRLAYATSLVLKLFCENLTTNEACQICSNCVRVIRNTHPNLIFVEPAATKDDGTKTGLIKIEQIREIIAASNKTNFEKGLSAFIVSHMHQATKSAANALLKVIEESGSNQVFIALAPSRTSVLATIASRLVVHQVLPNLGNYLTKKAEVMQKIISISEASLAARFFFCEQFSIDKEKLVTELNELIEECHVMLRNKEASPLFILKVREALEKAVLGLKINLNPRLIVERLILREWPILHK